jgi:hypothetical protein
MLCVSLKVTAMPPKNQTAAKSRPSGVVYKRGGRCSSMAALSIGEGRLPLFHEGVHAFLLIARGEK